jgi:nicotinamide-nucleotide amidase
VRASRLAIVAVGTEVTEGRIANTNAAWIARRFLRAGIETAAHVAAPDDREEMRRAFEFAAARAGTVVVTGGLGPTLDDITRDVAAEMAGVPLEEDVETVRRLEGFFAMLGRQMTPNNRRQALFPRGAAILPNARGTAPGFSLTVAGARFHFVPGVPHESEAMIEASVLPPLEAERAAAGAGAVRIRRLNCFGLPESKVDALLAPRFPGKEPELAFNVSDGVVAIYLTARRPSGGEAESLLERAAGEVRAALGGAVFSEGEVSLEEALLDACRARGATLALAESCTGGLAASRVTRVAGASDVLRGAVVAYANEAKTALLGVPAELIAAHGAVSREVALAMARGACRALEASAAAGITGVAGPSGGTAAKPVGTVHVAVVAPGVERSREVRLGGDRGFIQRIAAMGALDQVRRAVLGLPETG